MNNMEKWAVFASESLNLSITKEGLRGFSVNSGLAE